MCYRIEPTGDVMLGRNVDDRQRQRAVTAVWGDLLDRLRDPDGLFVIWSAVWRPADDRAVTSRSRVASARP